MLFIYSFIHYSQLKYNRQGSQGHLIAMPGHLPILKISQGQNPSKKETRRTESSYGEEKWRKRTDTWETYKRWRLVPNNIVAMFVKQMGFLLLSYAAAAQSYMPNFHTPPPYLPHFIILSPPFDTTKESICHRPSFFIQYSSNPGSGLKCLVSVGRGEGLCFLIRSLQV